MPAIFGHFQSYSQNAELGGLVEGVLTTRHDPRREQIAAGIGALRLEPGKYSNPW
jgi:hypothetical protein